MLKTFLIMTTLLSMSALRALEIDEKLTLRFLKVSNSKKTVLINRGAEDGLAINDHAKFFITTGVIARGVAEKVSPSRSIWSLYRVVDPAEITDGKVLNLKISSPVKITEDPSKSIKEESIPAGSDKMSMKEGAEVETTAPVLNDADQKELEGLGIEDNEKPVKKLEQEKKTKKKDIKEVSMEDAPSFENVTLKNWEVFGTLYVNALSGTIDNPNNNGGTEALSSSVDFSAGLERYFSDSNSLLKNVSLNVFIHKRNIENDSVETSTTKISTDWLEYGGGASYHFYNTAASVGKLIGFGNFSGGMGTIKSTITFKTATDETTNPFKGTEAFFSLGVGAKYVLTNGFGIRATLDYYHATESLTDGLTDLTFTRKIAGPRIQFGLSYRF